MRCPLCPAAAHLISALSWRSSRLRFRGMSSLSTTPVRHRPSVGKKGGHSGASPPKSLVFLEFRQSPGHNHGVGRKASKAGEPLPEQFLRFQHQLDPLSKLPPGFSVQNHNISWINQPRLVFEDRKLPGRRHAVRTRLTSQQLW